MPRPATVRWHEGSRAWVSDVGPFNEKGRRRPVYFREWHGRTLGPKDRHRADSALSAYLEERDRAESAVDLADPTVDQLRLLYLSHCKAALSVEGYRQNRNGCNRFAEFVHGGRPAGGLPARALTATLVQAWVDSLRAKGQSPNYMARQYSAVQAMLNWASNPVPGRRPERLLVGGNPVRAMAVQGIAAPAKVERVASPKEAADFLRFFWRRHAKLPRGERFDRNLAVMFRALIRTGARPGELCELLWSDIDWDAGRPSTGHAFAKATIPPERWKSGRHALTRGRQPKARVIYFPPAIRRALLRELARDGRHEQHVFQHVDNGTGGGLDAPGKPWDSKALAGKVRKVRKAAVRAGVKLKDVGKDRFTNYVHRHTFISRALMKGVDPTTTAELSGTSERQIQGTYGHLLDGHLAGAMERIAGRRPGQG